MPSGKTHNKATLITAVAATAASYIYQPLLGPESLAVIAGCMSGLLLTPDHDVDSGNRSHKLVRGAFGRLPAWLWARIWHAYAVVDTLHFVMDVVSTEIKIRLRRLR